MVVRLTQDRVEDKHRERAGESDVVLLREHARKGDAYSGPFEQREVRDQAAAACAWVEEPKEEHQLGHARFRDIAPDHEGSREHDDVEQAARLGLVCAALSVLRAM